MEMQNIDGIIKVNNISNYDKTNKISRYPDQTDISCDKNIISKKTLVLPPVTETEDDIKHSKGVEPEENSDFIKAEFEHKKSAEIINLELGSNAPEQSILKAQLQGLVPDSEIVVGSGEFPTFNHFMKSIEDTSSCLCHCHTEKTPPENKLYRCSTCEELLCCKCLWQAHNVAHKNHTRFVCHTCGKAYHYRSDLKRHLAVHEVIKPHECEICSRRFNQIGHLMTHRLTHTGEKPFLCDICGKAFNRKSNLLKHKLVHSGDRPFVCEECNSTFTRKGDLGRHRLLHTGEKPYSCKLCNKAFTQKPHLVNHQSIHTGIRPFICQCCDKSFNRKSNLIQHQKCHSKVVVEEHQMKQNPYFTCEHCNATFFDQNTLEEHREEHGNTDLYSCSLCEKSFSHKLLLISHRGTHHNVQPFTCNFCNKTFNSSLFFRKHQTAHVKRLINKRDSSIIYKTVNLPENVMSRIKEEPLDENLYTDENSLEESNSLQLLQNNESPNNCVSFLEVADLLKVGHKSTKEIYSYSTRKRVKSNKMPLKDESENNENIPSDDSSSEDSQFRLLSALKLQISYSKHSKYSRFKNLKCDESPIINLTIGNPVSSETSSNSLPLILKTVTPDSNVPKTEQSGQILRKILSSAEPVGKIRNKHIESKQCVYSGKTTWNMSTVSKTDLKS